MMWRLSNIFTERGERRRGEGRGGGRGEEWRSGERRGERREKDREEGKGGERREEERGGKEEREGGRGRGGATLSALEVESIGTYRE